MSLAIGFTNKNTTQDKLIFDLSIHDRLRIDKRNAVTAFAFLSSQKLRFDHSFSFPIIRSKHNINANKRTKNEASVFCFLNSNSC